MKKVMLMILDGWGLGKDYNGNAISLANTPNFDKLIQNYPNTTLDASGLAVGLPEGQMGNSEVGHLNIGAGKVVYQDLTKITKAIEDKDFFKNIELLNAINHAKENNSKLHLMGLVSHGGVHSHMKHLFAILQLCKMQNFNNVFIHAFLDGRDVSPTAGKSDIQELIDEMNNIGVGKLATISGRYYAMDRDKRWDRIEKAYNAITIGEGLYTKDPVSMLKESYAKNITDEFIIPTVIVEENNSEGILDSNDSVIFFNFRPDRAREMTRAIIDKKFDGFKRKKELSNLYYVCMTQYDATIANVCVAYPPETHKNTLGEIISKNNLKQLRIAETEKYAHVTFFFNGGEEKANIGEDRKLISSPKVATYDLQPEMSALEVTDNVVDAIKNDKYDLIVLNYANTDMVGHTGVVEAAIKAVETVDSCIERVLKAVEEKDIVLFITADHGNSEYLIDENTKEAFTAHTTNKVPFIEFPNKDIKLKNGKLSDIAPTILDVLNIEKPEEMTGNSLIEN
ncbi:2,3-bisphosphoglycerate-independent phosphoglycerate mutase [Miniphocaeibacter massiliensis]|uniref:2,3-bisphosphoglycerate-independent phosphoglycerate mutase n=1 Tax=Miniphocaeibacter massiliensis TaxID=2041841 RepID=UPI000C07B20D|nr:2,3-bisphosphoglycerate-independent phosphoglycerate mutase [Miniphocaeibacter massiliensis]